MHANGFLVDIPPIHSLLSFAKFGAFDHRRNCAVPLFPRRSGRKRRKLLNRMCIAPTVWGSKQGEDMALVAERMKLVSDSITLAVSAKANALKKAGVDVVGFGAGEPDFDTPTFIKDAAKAALDKGQTKYTPTPCIPELKAAIAEKFSRENYLPYKPENITTGAGGKHCLYMAFMAVLNPGDEVLIPTPYWVSYPEQAKLAGGVNKFIAGQEKNGFKITPQQLEAAITPKTKIFLINSPSNPAGHMYSPEELKGLADVIAKHPNIVVFSDEIYEKLVYGNNKFVSFATLHPSLIESIVACPDPRKQLSHPV